MLSTPTPMNRAIGPVSARRAMPLQVLERGADDVDARVGVVDPVDRHLVDPQPAPLGEDEQLGVEEPGVVAHVGEQAVERVAADGLEAALRVGEAGAQRRVQEAVVAARDDLALRAADDARAVREARADREVAVAGEQRGDERQQRAQVGREVDVHVGDDPRLARATRRRAARGRGPCARGAGTRRRAALPRGRGRSRGVRVGARVVGDRRSASRTGRPRGEERGAGGGCSARATASSL